MRLSIGVFAVVTAILALALVSDLARAADVRVEPTAEQQARCAVIADGKCPMVYAVRALKFPDKAEELGSLTRTARMGIFKPSGNGPFPVVMILHSCAAVDFDPDHIGAWVKRAIRDGYVAFVVDSWGQRGIPELCANGVKEFPPFLSLHLDVRTRDAYEALAHLRSFPFVDMNRITAVGFSNGGRTAYLLASAQMAKKYALGPERFAAVASVYGKCSYMLSDVERPVLALLGEIDEDGDPKVCVPMLSLIKERGGPVEWHVYPKTGHAWDSPKFRNPQTVKFIGHPNGVWFAYDAQTADDSRDRVFAFFAKQPGR